MVVWRSAEGEPTDIQRLDIWSPHQGLSQPLSHVLASVCVCVRVRGDTQKKNIYSKIFLYLFDRSLQHRNSELEEKHREWGGGVRGRGEKREAG